MKIIDRAPFTVLCDTREPSPSGLIFPATVSIVHHDGSRDTRPVQVRREMLPTGDYSTPTLRHIACVERKAPGDLAACLTHERERFDRELARMKRMRWACIVVEGDMTSVLDGRLLHINAVLGAVASFLARYSVATLFASHAGHAAWMTLALLRRWEDELRKEQSRGRLPLKRRSLRPLRPILRWPVPSRP